MTYDLAQSPESQQTTWLEQIREGRWNNDVADSVAKALARELGISLFLVQDRGEPQLWPARGHAGPEPVAHHPAGESLPAGNLA